MMGRVVGMRGAERDAGTVVEDIMIHFFLRYERDRQKPKKMASYIQVEYTYNFGLAAFRHVIKSSIHATTDHNRLQIIHPRPPLPRPYSQAAPSGPSQASPIHPDRSPTPSL